MPKKYRWAIVGLGNIAHSFVKYFDQPDGEIYAVCSRSQAKADAFANDHQIPKAYGDLSALLADPQVDIVYVATPHNYHLDTILPALKAGKHVFSEKAITMTSAQLNQAKALAAANQLVLAEAMTLYHMPLYQKLHAFADDHQLGALKMVQASFGSFKEPDPTNRFFNPELAGGALLDIGVYALAFVREFLTAKPYITGTTMHRFSTGVDEAETISLRNANDELANIALTFRAKMPKQGIVAYENGYFTIDTYPRADHALFTDNQGQTQVIQAGASTNAMNYEIADMQRMVAGNLANTSLVKTTDVMDIMTAARQQWDYRYPFE
ncbi:Gfo/Idh/MocA family protein [Lactiplantibacillus songbeiensis]|uniref:Gfo/Idh/MocA family protein n=1 Tax=Lactiplantibacillus songbeiensis TaxID=2559920 RepID=A0ABW4C3C1_9LACO|nr:Gfo/Idh/MocA family oxidoreductase [Lactiplantibacillus songbeiensis]